MVLDSCRKLPDTWSIRCTSCPVRVSQRELRCLDRARCRNSSNPWCRKQKHRSVMHHPPSPISWPDILVPRFAPLDENLGGWLGITDLPLSSQRGEILHSLSDRGIFNSA